MKSWRRLFIKPPELANLKAGEAGEEWVCYLYRLEGWKIVARKFEIYWKKKIGELDIICRKGKSLRIVEVRTRRDENFMAIIETVNFRKQTYLRRMAKIFLQQNPQYDNYEIQIDVAAVLIDPFDNFIKSVKIIENAIEDVA